jgi:micrococcal nuclease
VKKILSLLISLLLAFTVSSSILADISLAQGKSYQLTQLKKKERIVYITRTGAKYHRAGCRYLRRSKIAIPLSQAKALGYQACKVCRP